MPMPARIKPAAGARAALWPPACSLSSEPGCLRLPKPLARTGDELLDSGEAVLRFVDRNVAFLTGKSEYTRSIAAADVDGDGDLDVLLGNYNSPSRVLLNAGDGTFPTSITLPRGSAITGSIAEAKAAGTSTCTRRACLRTVAVRCSPEAAGVDVRGGSVCNWLVREHSLDPLPSRCAPCGGRVGGPAGIALDERACVSSECTVELHCSSYVDQTKRKMNRLARRQDQPTLGLVRLILNS